jgi:hypothetical protein
VVLLLHNSEIAQVISINITDNISFFASNDDTHCAAIIIVSVYPSRNKSARDQAISLLYPCTFSRTAPFLKKLRTSFMPFLLTFSSALTP